MRGSCQGKLQFARLFSSGDHLPNGPTILGKTQSLPGDRSVGTFANERKQWQDLYLLNKSVIALC